MGEAKRRADQMREWQTSLSEEEKVVADVASRMFDRFVKPSGATGMCYRLTFLLTEILEHEYGLRTEPIVGYVCDGTGDIMASHAWLEINGKRTDLSLGSTEHPDVQLVGEVLILDRVIRPGIRYTYSREQSAKSIEAIKRNMSDPHFALLVKHKNAEHTRMIDISKTSHSRRTFLDSAPDGLNYQLLSKIIDGTI